MFHDGYQESNLPEHPYLAGNFTPVTKTTPPVPITYSGTIPKELHGGMYVRNGGNPVSNSELGRDYHWFDGDGMLTGVWFERSKDPSSEACTPHFVNQFILTDLYVSSFENKALKTPILPSIATLVSPVASLIVILWRIFRAALLVLLSHFPGSRQAIKRISVANTSILYHDGRALATCESGPPIRVQLPGLETVGWYNGSYAEGEILQDVKIKEEPGFGGTGLNSWMREWTTGHPKVDPTTGEMILFHCNFTAPYIHYSVIPKEKEKLEKEIFSKIEHAKLLNAPVPGCSGGKMMHDFGVSKLHTVILDLPLTLTPFNLLKNQPVVAYEPSKPSRFGVFPRRDPAAVRWFETTGCCIFHTANTWDELDARGKPTAVNMLACRLTSASLVYSAGNIAPPPHPGSPHDTPSHRPLSFFAKYDDESSVDVEKIYNPEDDNPEASPLLPSSQQQNTTSTFTNPAPPISTDDEEQCRLYYYRFSLQNPTKNLITHQYALSTIPFEFPTVNPSREMQSARYIYGCSTTNASFGAALGKATKIDVIVKMDVQSLLARRPSGTKDKVVDRRSIASILDSPNENNDIQAFKLPPGCFAQEARFVSRIPSSSSEEEELEEDDGYLLFYVFDESQLSPSPSTTSSPSSSLPGAQELLDKATSTLYVLSARDMKTVVCKVELPARVPYGLHGNWFAEKEILRQRGVGMWFGT
ncbi:carotenoid oxygenase [Periconia macrospinosa]|uniref:Carotenoid oxygenase n=1 Tax=Periconia macrospinosa TaxID=97972 RepID=A0A2V1DHG3_9PLEO|nr:carotenoid oxygenase [Periconia macrospinosa]